MSKKQAIQELLNRKSSTTGIHKSSDAGIQEYNSGEMVGSIAADKKKATFELNQDLHTELKVFAAKQNKKMVDVVEEALKQYFKNH